MDIQKIRGFGDARSIKPGDPFYNLLAPLLEYFTVAYELVQATDTVDRNLLVGIFTGSRPGYFRLFMRPETLPRYTTIGRCIFLFSLRAHASPEIYNLKLPECIRDILDELVVLSSASSGDALFHRKAHNVIHGFFLRLWTQPWSSLDDSGPADQAANVRGEAPEEVQVAAATLGELILAGQRRSQKQIKGKGRKLGKVHGRSGSGDSDSEDGEDSMVAGEDDNDAVDGEEPFLMEDGRYGGSFVTLADPSIQVIAISCLEDDMGAFGHVFSTTGKFVQTLFLLRLTVLYEAHRRKQHKGGTLRDHLRIFDTWLSAEGVGTYGSLKRALRYLAWVSFRSVRERDIHWAVQGEVLNYKGTLIPHIKWCRLVHILQDTIADLLPSVFLGTPYTDLDSRRHAGESQPSPGYDRLVHSDDRDREGSKCALAQHIMNNGALALRFATDNNWDKDEIRSWFTHLARLRTLIGVSLFVNTVVTPLRGTHLLDMRVVDSATKSCIQIDSVSGAVLIRSISRGTQNQTDLGGKGTYITNPFVGSVIVQVELLARPLAIFFGQILFGLEHPVYDLHRTAMFVHVDRHITTKDFSRELISLTKGLLGIGIGIERLCHIKSSWMQRTAALRQHDHLGCSTGAVLTGHTDRIRETTYGAMLTLRTDVLEATRDWQDDIGIKSGYGIATPDLWRRDPSWVPCTLGSAESYDRKIQDVLKRVEELKKVKGLKGETSACEEYNPLACERMILKRKAADPDTAPRTGKKKKVN
ncbi:unnamed protein product [Peniophora sp. CBMAI 1063]|nr:unnamed protein product [Peniophora sp. CBMAI 1063]